LSWKKKKNASTENTTLGQNITIILDRMQIDHEKRAKQERLLAEREQGRGEETRRVYNK
jgi:hypothetical protein